LRPGRALQPAGRLPPRDSIVADATGHAVGVEALEQQLGRLARCPDQVAEPRKRDALRGLELAHERLARALVRRRRDGVAVADPHEAAVLLQKPGELLVRHFHGLGAELGFERRRLLLALTERAAGAGAVQLGAAQLEAELRQQLARPRLAR